jgi:D-2-hydroxyacid dehydrogenase (NADP+)
MEIYISNQIPESIRENLPTEHVTYLNSSSIAPADFSQIEVAWGFDSTVQQILDTPDNHLKWIQSFSAGVDYFPTQQLVDQHVTLTNTSGIHGVAIANTVLLYALYFARNFNSVLKMRTTKVWDGTADYQNLATLTGKRWLIFGTGHIGQAIAKVAQNLGGITVGVNHSGHPSDYFTETIADDSYQSELTKADIIVNILPLTPETNHMFNENFFEQLDQLELFINVGRGRSVDTNALLHALDNGKVKHAALDVFETEPLPADHPLWNYPQVLITPHNSAVSSELLPQVHAVFVDNLNAYLTTNHLTTNLVDLNKGY